MTNKLSLAASGSFSLSLAGSSSPVKVPSKRHTWVSLSVVFTTSKSPKIFNNRPVNKLVFSALITPTITSTTTASQMAAKAKNSRKQQQTVTTAMVTLNLFVVPDEIFGKISTAAASPLPDMNGNSSSTSPKMGQDQPLAVLFNVVISSRLSPIPMEMESTVSSSVSGARFSGWMASNLIPGATFKIKMVLLGFLFQLLPGCIGLKSEYLNGATKVVISNEVFLTTLKIAWSSGVASVSFLFLSVALHNISLGTFSNDIKTALGIFGVVTSVKLKSVGLWQYAVVNFKNISSAAVALFNWSVLEIISSRDAFKAKLVNLPFGYTAFEISNLVSQCHDLNHLTVNCKKLPPLSPKLPSNIFGGPKNFKSSFVRSKSYAKTAAIVVSPGAAAADMELDLSGSPKTATPVLPAVFSVSNTAVKSRLASLESHLSELSVLIKILVEPIGVLVALVIKLLFTPSAIDVSVKECIKVTIELKKTFSLLNFMTTNRAKSKKVANVTFPIVTNKVSTRKGLSVIEAARQNVLATFPLKNNSNKLPLVASGSFSSPLAGSSSSVKVLLKRHTWISPSVVSTTSKSPKIFNNRPVNKLVFPALTAPTTTFTTTASQMAVKIRSSVRSPQQQPALFLIWMATAAAYLQDQLLAVLPDVIFSGRSSPIPVAKQSINPNNLKDWADQIEMETTVPSSVSGAADAGA
ncbi:hypothetical protein G9A89_004467 [Geosiphon pyriformis]|nr:hypothetical protein G9A89_004467 [Geosiphon pyriformis]